MGGGGGLINFLSLKSGGGGALRVKGLNKGFTVWQLCNCKSFWNTLGLPNHTLKVGLETICLILTKGCTQVTDMISY